MEVLFVGDAGALMIGLAGAVVSTVKVMVAAVVLWFPAASTA
jgi:hypothetical protein